MSKFIDEIIADIKTNPDLWQDNEGWGVKKDNIEIWGYGNTCVLSIVSVRINGKDMPTDYVGRFKLERTISNWYKTVSLKTISI